MSKQPRDDANAPIPVLGLKPGGGQSVSISTENARSAAISNHIRVVTLFSDADCFIETGDSTVTASTETSHFLPGSTLFDISLGSEIVASENDRFIAAITSSGSGTLRISERE
tara:strand:+ start:567 stop:905 length:339 start_codon:yes stop_codon:yes gene_type:complete